MTTTITQKRQAAGQPTGGQFAAHERAEGSVALRQNWPATATHAQRERARAQLRIILSFRGRVQAEPTPDEVETAASEIAEMEACFISWQHGIPHQDDPAFARIWEGIDVGFSRDTVQRELAETKRRRLALASGEMLPSEVIGLGANATHEDATDWLNRQVDTFELALECGGRNLTVNQAGVRAERIRAEIEAQPF